MGIYTSDVAIYVVRPVLKLCDLWCTEVEQLILGTAAIESAMGTYLHQKGGPALGIYQMEPNTHDDIYLNFLNSRPALKSKILQACEYVDRPSHSALSYNLAYATCMIRVHYMRVLEPLPNKGNVEAMAEYWKDHYNTASGAGHPDLFIAAYYKYVQPIY